MPVSIFAKALAAGDSPQPGSAQTSGASMPGTVPSGDCPLLARTAQAAASEGTRPKERLALETGHGHARSMARQPRIEGAGLIHHVTGHSNPEVDAFPDDVAIRSFLALLANVASEQSWSIFAYCVLSTHYHLLLETEQPNLGVGMRALHGLHAS